MRLDKIALLVALPIAVSLAAAGLAVAESADEPKPPPDPSQEVASPQAQGPTSLPPAGDPAGPGSSAAPIPGAAADEAPVETGVAPADEGASAGEAPAGGTAEQQALAEEAPEPAPEPVTGAFGIPLGQVFDPAMVEKVIAEEERGYRKAKDVEAMGKRYQVEPKVSSPHFNRYRVSVNEHGIVYAVDGLHEPAEKASACKVTKKLGEMLKEKYGKPRGQGWAGSWYAFRDMSSDQYRGVRLYAQKCRIGRYSVFYSDDAAKLAEEPLPTEPEAEPKPESGPQTRPDTAEAADSAEAAGL